MKFCLSSQQSEKMLAQADEIKTDHFKEVMRLLRKFPKADVIYEIPFEYDESELNELQELSNKYDKRLIICVHDFDLLTILKNRYDLRYYFGYYVATFLELRVLLDLGSCYVKITSPLTHQLQKVMETGAHIRLVPNLAATDEVYMEYGIQGSWIRPEDSELYESYGDLIAYEFEDCNEKKEATLFDIYKNKKAWAGPMNLLFSNINTTALNRLIPPDLAKERIKCGQRCLIDGRCHLCKTYLTLADEKMLGKIVRATEEEQTI